ncbi:hypothetical protein [Streptomyces sp. NPDC001100]
MTLPAGRRVLTIDQDTGGWNVNYLAFAASSDTHSTNATASTTLKSSAA